MSFHSRDFLDVVAPVREVERVAGIRFPHEGSQQIRWVVQGKRQPRSSLSSAVLRRLGEVRLASEQDRLRCESRLEQPL